MGERRPATVDPIVEPHIDEISTEPTWRLLIASLLAYKGAETYDPEAVRTCQNLRWGRSVGETAVLELSAAAAPDVSVPVADRLAHLDWRLELLRLRIADHAPRFVVCYGTGPDTTGQSYVEHWRCLAGVDLTVGEPTIVDRTVFLVEPHPSAHGTTNERWMGIGQALRAKTALIPEA